MTRLSIEQSTFLKSLQNGSLEFASLSAEEKEIVHHLKAMRYIDTREIQRSTSDHGIFKSWTEIDTVSISEAGKMYLLNEKISVDEYLFLRRQIEGLEALAETAISDSESSKKDARFSKIVSITAIVISIIAIIIPVVMQVL